jgi:agmatine deiminase
MAWPNPGAEWPDWPLAEDAFARLAHTILDFEPVAMLVREEEEREARTRLSREIELLIAPLDDAWLRDIGPTFVVDRERGLEAGIDWRFNGWGEKWPFELDADVARRILEHLGLPRIESDLVMEGGAVHFDGAGTLLAVRQSVLHENRRPGRDEEEVADQLCKLLGAQEVIWLDRGLAADHTDGHVDEVAAFAAPGLVVAATASVGHPDHDTLMDNLRHLREAHDARGQVLEVVELPLPRRVFGPYEELALSYVNFYLPNGAVVVPAFGDATADDRARGILGEVFPGREVRSLPALGVAQNGGGFHCLTQQEPALARRPSESTG